MALRIASRAFAALAAFAALTSAGFAGDGSSSASDIKLGAIPRYSDEAAAQAACKPDGVVWADQRNGFFYPKFLPEYGKTPHGTFTCYQQAQKADYWSLAPSPDAGHEGREFPMFFCYTCS
jgi:hypothetical protein